MKPLRLVIVGCGKIVHAYGQTLGPYAADIEILGAMDLDQERARQFVETYGGRVYSTLEEVLADQAVDLVVNLSIHHAHYAVIRQCLQAGKPVYSEKPLALTSQEAWELVQLAQTQGLRLSCAPSTLLGEAQQTAWKLIRQGSLGPVRLAYAEVNWGRIESWHPTPGPFYQVGPLFDVGVYPLTILTAIFGPARRVSGFGAVLFPDRVTREGIPFHLDTPDFVTAAIVFANGSVARLTTNFYVGHHNKQKGIEFHGDNGSLYLSDWQSFNGQVEMATFGGAYESVPLIKEPYQGVEWSRGLMDLVQAMREDRLQRITGEQAAHVVDILCAIQTAQTSGRTVDITSAFSPPAPMDWAKEPQELF